MPRRWSDDTRTFAYLYLCQRDGEWCKRPDGCGKTPDQLSHPLEIDHINGVKTNSAPANLQLLCKPCNVVKENRCRPLRKPSPSNAGGTRPPMAYRDAFPSPPWDIESETARPNGTPTTRIVKDTVDYQAGSAEMRANDQFEDPFRHWLIGRVIVQGHVSRQEAVNAGAELIGSNPQTTTRYLAKLTSSLGPLDQVTDALRQTLIVLKGQRPLPVQPSPDEHCKAPGDCPGPPIRAGYCTDHQPDPEIPAAANERTPGDRRNEPPASGPHTNAPETPAPRDDDPLQPCSLCHQDSRFDQPLCENHWTRYLELVDAAREEGSFVPDLDTWIANYEHPRGHD